MILKRRRRRPIEFLPMVKWYDPPQLIQSAHHVLISSILGRHSDHRLLEALGADPVKVFDCTTEPMPWAKGTPFWVDYVSDTGDGWNSTYAIASTAAQPLTITDSTGKPHPTERGSVLVMGGDEVYPIANRMEYEKRFVAPLEAALPSQDEPRPKIFAVPGNHDWYDSLVSFTRLFCGKTQIGGWDAPQSRSYFAVRLPYGWWILGTDVQLASDIDKPQMEFFKQVAAQLEPEDRVILCVAEPIWVQAHTYNEMDPAYAETNLLQLEAILGKRVAVFLAGDLHHYRRHEAADGTNVQKITAGGGGAFLHPTHDTNVNRLEEKDHKGHVKRVFELKATYPEPELTRKLTWRNLKFLPLNPSFGLVTGILYACTSWSVQAKISNVTNFWKALETTAIAAVENPYRAFWVLATWLGFILFTDTHSVIYRRVMGTVHAVLHLAATFFIGWGAQYLIFSKIGVDWHPLQQILATLLIVAAGGFLVGPAIMGIYLLVSLNIFGRHGNEAFSGLAIEDYKHFLRLKIDTDGSLTIFPIKIDRVPRTWRKQPAAGPEYVSDDPKASAPTLIEKQPIVIPAQPVTIAE